MTATAHTRDVLGEATLGELEGNLRGRLVRPSDPDYDQARTVWNGAHDRHPALIIRCAGAAVAQIVDTVAAEQRRDAATVLRRAGTGRSRSPVRSASS